MILVSYLMHVENSHENEKQNRFDKYPNQFPFFFFNLKWKQHRKQQAPFFCFHKVIYSNYFTNYFSIHGNTMYSND